jgi:hypothetical protein
MDAKLKELFDKGEQLCEIGESLKEQAIDSGYSPDGAEDMTEAEEPVDDEAAPSGVGKKKDKAALAISLFRKA